MTAQTRPVLKGYFNERDIPTEGNYADVIDSFALGTELDAKKMLTDYQNVAVVDAGGNGDYTSLAAAIAAITDASVTKPYAILMMPGIYSIVSTYVGLKAYVHVIAPFGLGSATLACDDNSDIRQDAGFTSGECRLKDMIITGSSVAMTGTTTGKIILDHCRVVVPSGGVASSAMSTTVATPIDIINGSYIENNSADAAFQLGVNAVTLVDHSTIVNLHVSGYSVRFAFSGSTTLFKARHSVFLTGGGAPFRSAVTKTAAIALCGTNYAWSNVTSSITTPYNVLDANF